MESAICQLKLIINHNLIKLCSAIFRAATKKNLGIKLHTNIRELLPPGEFFKEVTIYFTHWCLQRE